MGMQVLRAIGASPIHVVASDKARGLSDYGSCALTVLAGFIGLQHPDIEPPEVNFQVIIISSPQLQWPLEPQGVYLLSIPLHDDLCFVLIDGVWAELYSAV